MSTVNFVTNQAFIPTSCHIFWRKVQGISENIVPLMKVTQQYNFQSAKQGRYYYIYTMIQFQLNT